MEADDPIQLGLSQSYHPADIDSLRAEIAETQSTRRGRFAGKFFLAAISSILWVGGYLSAMANFQMEESSIRQNGTTRLTGEGKM